MSNNKYLYIREYFIRFPLRAYSFLKNIFYYLFKTPPFDIQIEITQKCNLNCIMCHRHRVLKQRNEDMSLEKFKKIFNQFPDLRNITFGGMGEVYLNKDFFKIIKYVKSKNVAVIFFDNFVFIDKKAANELIDLKADKIICSLDGATKETYEKIRIGAGIENVINNVKDFFRIKKERKADFPEICFSYTVSKYNINEIIKFIELISSISGQERTLIIFSKLIGNRNLSVRVPEKTIAEANEKAKKLNILLQWENIEKKTIDRCSNWLRPYINIRGEFFPCCFMMFRRPLGNILEQNYLKIWNSRAYKDFRKTIKKGEIPPLCQFCGNFRAKNNNL